MRGTARYFAGLLCGFLAIAAVWFSLFVASFGYYDVFGDRSVAAWFQIKTEAAIARMAHPKIVLAAGSNVLYGLDAADLERTFGVPCVNFGTHASLPFDYLASRWKGLLRPGDLLVIAPEYRYLERDPEDMNDVFVGYMLGADPHYFWRMTLASQIELVLTTDFHRLMMPIFTPLRENQRTEDVQRLWTKACFLDEQGDYIANTPGARDTAGLKKLLASKIKDVLIDGSRMENATKETPYWQAIHKLAVWAKHRGVRIVYTAPSVLALPEVSSEAYRNFFSAVEAHYRALGIPVLIRQEDNIYPESLMFDSVYHLNTDGRAIRMEHLKRALEPIVKQQFPGAKLSSCQPGVH